MQKTIFLVLSWQTPFLVTSYRNQPWHVGKKEFCHEDTGEIKGSLGGLESQARKLQGKEQCSQIQVTLCGCRHVWGLGSCHVPPPTLDIGRYHSNCCLCSHLWQNSSRLFLLLYDICFQFRESRDGYIWWSMPRSCAHLWPQKYLTFSIPIMLDGLF